MQVNDFSLETKDVPNIRAISLLPGWKPEPDSELSKIDPAILDKFTSTPKSDPDATIEEVDLEAKPAVETVSEDEEKEVERDDKQHPHVRHSPIQFLSDKTGKIIPLEDEQLLNRHHLLKPEEDGTRRRAQIVGVEREFKHPKFSSEQHIKFRLKVNDEEHDEHIACTEMLSFVEENFLQPEDGVTWTMRRIITHSRFACLPTWLRFSISGVIFS